MAIGAPNWHGDDINALLDSMIWHRDINELQPPYRIVLHNTAALPKKVKNVIVLMRDYLALDRQEHIVRNGDDVDISLEILS